MSSRHDLMESRSFTSRRVSSALVTGEPNARGDRLRPALLAGTMVGVLLLGLTLSLGHHLPWVRGDWRTPGAVVVDAESGEVFVFDGQSLVPTPEIASARLLSASMGHPDPVVTSVPDGQLSQVPQAAGQGVPGAPADLPPASRLTTTPVVVCSTPSTGRTRWLSIDFAGADSDVAASTPGDGFSSAELAVGLSDNDRQWMVLGGVAHLLPQGTRASAVLSGVPTFAGAHAFLASLPQGIPGVPQGGSATPDRPVAPGATGVCATYTDQASGVPTISLAAARPRSGSPNGTRADGVHQGARSAALVRAPGQAAGSALLVVDGRGYPIPDAESLRALGYAGVTPTTLPAGTLAAIPPGLAHGVTLSASDLRPQ